MHVSSIQLDDPKINEFLWIDSCCKVADRVSSAYHVIVKFTCVKNSAFCIAVSYSNGIRLLQEGQVINR